MPLSHYHVIVFLSGPVTSPPLLNSGTKTLSARKKPRSLDHCRGDISSSIFLFLGAAVLPNEACRPWLSSACLCPATLACGSVVDLQPPEFKDEVPKKTSTQTNFYDLFINLSSVSATLLQNFIIINRRTSRGLLLRHRWFASHSTPPIEKRPFSRQPVPRQIQACCYVAKSPPHFNQPSQIDCLSISSLYFGRHGRPTGPLALT